MGVKAETYMHPLTHDRGRLYLRGVVTLNVAVFFVGG